MVVLFGDALKVTADRRSSTQGSSCRSVASSAGMVTDLQVSDGRSIVVAASAAGEDTFSLGFLEAPSTPVLRVQIPASTPMRVQLPDTGKPVVWRLRITTVGLGDLQICGIDN
jgi:hypothetical protein